MPKIKTRKSIAKRFKRTGSGKLMRSKVGRSHLRRRKRKRTKRLFDSYLVVEDRGTKKRVKRLAPYL